jgi:hypothetical protein
VLTIRQACNLSYAAQVSAMSDIDAKKFDIDLHSPPPGEVGRKPRSTAVDPLLDSLMAPPSIRG